MQNAQKYKLLALKWINTQLLLFLSVSLIHKF